MARLREAVVCEWTETVNTPSAQVRFKHFINSDKRDRMSRLCLNVNNIARPRRMSVSRSLWWRKTHEPVEKHLQNR